MTEQLAATSDRCSIRSRARGDALAGTALPTRRFLLVEDPGPWGSQAHPTGTLPPDVVSVLHAVAHEMSARMLLIRRPGRHSPSSRREWAVADVDLDEIRWGSVPTVAALADVDYFSGGSSTSNASYLICAQGRHDVCCATEGRPVAAEFGRRLPSSTWECSHVGGDRFAANVLVLPTGLVYGRVDTSDVDRLISAESSGVVVPELLRGRCGVAPVAQVAEAYVRDAWLEFGVDAIDVTSVAHLGRDVWRVTGQHSMDGRHFTAELHEAHAPVESGLTCAAVGPGLMRTWTVTLLEAEIDAVDHGLVD